jgi:hypothetical protein
MVERNSTEEFVQLVADIVQQLASAKIRTVLFVCVQAKDAIDGVRRLRTALPRIALPSSITMVGGYLQASRKQASLNAVFSVVTGVQYKVAGWMDDDVVLEPNCIAELAAAMRRRRYRGAVGPAKIPHRGTSIGSRLLFDVKTITQPAMNYPHGCCILVQGDVIRNGIPVRYSSDDGFVCFSLLRPHDDDPLSLLEILSTAHCHYVVGSPRGLLAKRIRRLLINHFVFLCDYPAAVGNLYLQKMLFHGFWPIGSMDWSHGTRFALKKWGLKLIYFGWFSLVGVELFVRGVLGRPLTTVAWGGGNQAASVPSTVRP